MRGAFVLRRARRRVALAAAIATIAVLGIASTAEAGVLTVWSGKQPTGTVGANLAVTIQGSGAYDAYPLVPATAKLYIDGFLVPRASYIASISRTSAYFYYSPSPKLPDGVRTFRVEVSDSSGRLSFHQWTATVAQPPAAVWVAPASGTTVHTGLPTITMSLSDNTPATTFTVAGAVHAGSATGPVAATFGAAGLPFGSNSFVPSAELPPGAYYLTAVVTDGAGNALSLSGAAARAFTASPAPAMTVIESCDGCHPAYRTAHPTRSATACTVCHVGYDGDHMEGTEYCADCHWQGWHTGGAGAFVAVTSRCVSCHTLERPDVPQHTAASVDAVHASSCEGCHVESLIARHSTTPEGSAYASQCDACHGSGDTRVEAAIAARSTTCSACHDAVPGHGFNPTSHVASIDTLAMAGTWPYIETEKAVSGTLMNVPYAYSGIMCLGCHTAMIAGPGGEHTKATASSAAAGCAACHPSFVPAGGMTPPWDKTCYACHTVSTVHAPANLSTLHSLTGDPAAEGSCGFVNPVNGRIPCHYRDIVQEHNRLINPQVGFPNRSLTVTCDQCHQSPATAAALASGGGWDGTCTDCHDGTTLPNHSVVGTARYDAVYALHSNPAGYYDNGSGFTGYNAIDTHGPLRVNPEPIAANKTLGCGVPTCHTQAFVGGGWPNGVGPACVDCHGPNVAPSPPYEGAYSWRSGTWTDEQALTSRLTITLAAPLPAASRLDFKTLYDIENGWDYGYVQISTDGGATWTNLPGNITTTTNPYGANLGNGITGSIASWADASFDLAAYAGQTVKLRFAYVCDLYVYGLGWKLDLMTIGPAGSPIFTDDAETAKPEMIVESTLSYWEWDPIAGANVWVTVPTTAAGWYRYTTP